MATSFDMLRDEPEIDVSSIDFSDLQAQYEVRLEEGLDTFVVIDGLPVVHDEEKMRKLHAVLLRKFSTIGKINEETLTIPLGGDGVSDKGFAFVEFATPQEAFAAIKKFHNTPLDRRHTLLLNKLNDIEKFGREGRVNEEYTAPVIPPFQPKEHLRWWLSDNRARDQYAILHGPSTSVFWQDKDEEKPTALVSREHWSDNFFQWSPLGTFMISMHGQGVQLWEGHSWTRKFRFPHPAVLLASMSPDEKFLVTWSQKPIAFNQADPGPFSFSDDGKNHVIWDVASGKPVRSFATIQSPITKDEAEAGKRPLISQFKWSADGSYVARINFEESVSVYELPSMNLIGKSSIKLKGVRDFDWAPASPKRHNVETPEQLFCYWSPEEANVPAMVGLVSVPSKEIVRSHNPFNVLDVRLHWQCEGKYLCAKVDSMSKSKKHNGTRLDIFRILEKGIPRETIEIKDEAVINLAWEPKGNRFVFISTIETGAIGSDVSRKTCISFYAPERVKEMTSGMFKLLSKNDKKTCNAIYWSPRGRFVATASVFPQRSFDIDFWDMDFQGNKEEEHGLAANLQLMNSSDHYNMTGGEWDPTGRYFVTYSDIHGKQGTEYGIHVYDLNGFQIAQRTIDNLRQFAWRPRPPTFLSKKEQKDIRKSLRDYSKIFDIQDQERKNRASQEVVDHRRKMLSEWYAWLEETDAELGAELASQYPPSLLEGEHAEVIEKIVEEILEESKEFI